MRLIDADEVIDILEFYLTEADGIHWALRDIKEQPTAYDIDKVVEQLEEVFDNWGLDKGKKGIMCEIVKGGVV